MTRVLVVLAFFLIGFSLQGCGDEEDVTVSLSVIPSSPFIIDTDFTYTDSNENEFVVSAPWFQARIVVVNQTKNTITISGAKYEVSYKKDGQTIKSAEKSLGASGCLYFNIMASESTEQLGQSRQGGANCEPSPTDDSLDDDEQDSNVTVYFEGLPEGAEDAEYTIKLQLQGWIGGASDPEERLTSSTLTFKTQ